MEQRIIADIEKNESVATVTVKGGGVVGNEQVEALFEELDHMDVHLVIEGDVRRIEEDAFQGYDFIKSVKIGRGVSEIGDGAFSWCRGLTQFFVDEESPFYEEIDGSLYEKGGGRIVQYAIGRGEGEALLPCGLVSVGRSAFSACGSLVSVTLPRGVKRIEDSAFSCCESLAHVELPSDLESIGSYAFCGCEALEEIALPDGCRIENEAFRLSGIKKC